MGPKLGGGGSKNKNLGRLSKLSQVLYRLLVNPQNTNNSKTNRPKWEGAGQRMKI